MKVLLVKLCEGYKYISELRHFLVKHPTLVLEIGFRPVVDPSQPFGFDVERTVPGDRWLRHQQQALDNPYKARAESTRVHPFKGRLYVKTDLSR